MRRADLAGRPAGWRSRLPDGVDKATHAFNSLSMTLEFAYRFHERTTSSSFRDLDDVVLTIDVTSDDGIPIPAGTEGTIVSVHTSDRRETYIVEFAEPEWTLATVGPDKIRLAESAQR